MNDETPVHKISLLRYFEKKDAQKNKTETEGLTVVGQAEGGLSTPSDKTLELYPFR